jgi:hypothetical protein
MLKLATAVTAALALAVPSSAAGAGFKEPVKVLWQHTGPANSYFGWGVSPLADINHDGATEAIVSEPGIDEGTTWVYSGRTGKVLHRFDGKPGDENGYAMADAGDTNRDGVHEILSGAPRQSADAEGHAYLAYVFSGRDGRKLYALPPSAAPEAFGTFFLAGVGDVNRDHVPDVYGADYGADDNGPD